MNVDDSESPRDPQRTYPYPQNAREATLTLHSLILNEIRDSDHIPFDQFMATALYHPTLGYYARNTNNVGREGDFFTSVSTGECFGMILAHRTQQLWLEKNKPTPFHLIEIGANNGQLALDILNTLQLIEPTLYQNLTYHIIEPLESNTSTQQQTLKNHLNITRHHSNLQALAHANLTGIILSNELIDALPVKLIKKQNNTWQELAVTAKNNQPTLHPTEIQDPELQNFTQSLPKNLPENYTTEYRPNLSKFTAELASILESGTVITIDYGHTRSTYYAPERITGTLRTFHKHTAGEDPLINIGDQDITAHVDFTQLASTFLESGFSIESFTRQDKYLITHATPWLKSLPSPLSPHQQKLIRQFQTLTHPTILGKQFQILETSYPAQQNNPQSLNHLELE